MRNKVVFITGAGAGIGRAMAIKFFQAGARLMLTDIDADSLGSLVKELDAKSVMVETICADMSDDPHANMALEEAHKKFGSLDIVINNAGIMDNFSPVHETSDHTWDRVLAVNINDPFFVCRASVRIFLKQGHGKIINIASIGGLFGGRAGAAYTASKHALIGLTKNIGYDYCNKDIHCNAIAPGGIDTDIMRELTMNPLGFKRMAAGTHNHSRIGTPEEIAEIASFLASNRSSFINGSVITADGGWTAY